MYTILPEADQITDMILCSLSYFVPGEQLAETEIPEVRRKVRVQPLLTSHYQNQKHSAFIWAATWAVSMSQWDGVHKPQLSKKNHNRRGMEPSSVCLPA